MAITINIPTGSGPQPAPAPLDGTGLEFLGQGAPAATPAPAAAQAATPLDGTGLEFLGQPQAGGSAGAPAAPANYYDGQSALSRFLSGFGQSLTATGQGLVQKAAHGAAALGVPGAQKLADSTDAIVADNAANYARNQQAGAAGTVGGVAADLVSGLPFVAAPGLAPVAFARDAGLAAKLGTTALNAARLGTSGAALGLAQPIVNPANFGQQAADQALVGAGLGVALPTALGTAAKGVRALLPSSQAATEATAADLLGRAVDRAGLDRNQVADQLEAGGAPINGYQPMAQDLVPQIGPLANGVFANDPSGALVARQTANQQALGQAGQALLPQASPQATRDFVQGQYGQMAAAAGQQEARLMQAVDAQSQPYLALPDKADTSAAARQALAAQEAAGRQQEATLWNAIDPENQVRVDGTTLQQRAAAIAALPGKMDDGTAMPSYIKWLAGNDSPLLSQELNLNDVIGLRKRLYQDMQGADGANLHYLSQMKQGVDSFLTNDLAGHISDPAAAARWADANAFSRQLNQTYRDGAVANALNAPDSAALGKLLLNGQGRGAREAAGNFVDAVGGYQQALPLASDYLKRDLASVAFNPETGAWNVKGMQAWLKNHQDVLGQFPEVNREIGNVLSAQKALDGFRATSQAGLDDYQKSVAGLYLNADPEHAMTKVLGSSDPGGAATQLLGQLKASPDAQDGVRRAFLEQALAAPDMSRFLGKNAAAAKALLPADSLQRANQIAQEMARAPQTGALIPGDLQPKTYVGSLWQKGGNALATAGGAALGGPVGAVAGNAASSALQLGREMSDKAVSEVLRDAILNPQKGALLLRKPGPMNDPSVTKLLAGYALRDAGQQAGQRFFNRQ